MSISPVGNDVVDLRDRETRPGAVHPRFDIRVFTPEERARLGEGPLSDRLRWSLWAAKESAFKAARKLHPEIPFHPRRFAVRLLADARERLETAREGLDARESVRSGMENMRAGMDNVRAGLENARAELETVRAELDTARAEVAHRVAGRFNVWMDGAKDWVHAVAAPAAEAVGRPPSVVAFLDDLEFPDMPDPGARVRELARRAVASMLSLDPGAIEVVTDENGIPRVVIRGRTAAGGTPLPVDLSLSHHGRLVACSWSRDAE